MVTAVALSGGIDSLTAAHRLKTSGEAIIGIHFVTGYESADDAVSTVSWQNQDTIPVSKAPRGHSIRNIADQLDVPVYLIDCRSSFRSMVVNYFINAYKAGRTPNPCMVCNAGIKFGILFSAAQKLGATRLATGHYARLGKANGRMQLLKGADTAKDQSYFLAMLTQAQLNIACFPLGQTTKHHVREIATQAGLAPAVPNESQDICFIRNQPYTAFLARHGISDAASGPIVDVDGKWLGRHIGLHHYTIGQRKGIGLPADRPYYVLRIDADENRLVVGFKEALYADACHVSRINWIAGKPDAPLPVQTRIRYRHQAVPSVLIPLSADSALIRFNRPEAAVTPGQAAVCYQGERVVAGGWIANPIVSETNETEI